MNKKHLWALVMLVLCLVAAPIAMAEDHDEDDVEVFGLELEKLLNLFSGLLALGLSVLTFGAYRRNQNSRLLFVGTAFLLFGIKGLLMSAELFFGEWAFVDPVSSAMDFVILVTFFIGVLKK